MASAEARAALEIEGGGVMETAAGSVVELGLALAGGGAPAMAVAYVVVSARLVALEVAHAVAAATTVAMASAALVEADGTERVLQAGAEAATLTGESATVACLIVGTWHNLDTG